jgi:hypothetical protein
MSHPKVFPYMGGSKCSDATKLIEFLLFAHVKYVFHVVGGSHSGGGYGAARAVLGVLEINDT